MQAGWTWAVALAAATTAAAPAALAASAYDRPPVGVTEVAPDGTATWVDPDTGQRYRLGPAPATAAADGRQCREYTAMATIDGQLVQTFGTVCRRPDGAWQISN